MRINTDNLVSITDANQNFSRVARMVDENRAEIILKNNVPRYILMEFTQMEEEYEKRGYGGTLWCEQVFKRIKNQSCKRSNVIGKSERGYFRWCKQNNGPVKNTAILSKMNKTSFGRVRTVMGTE